jgi:hypothetical protein
MSRRRIVSEHRACKCRSRNQTPIADGGGYAIKCNDCGRQGQRVPLPPFADMEAAEKLYESCWAAWDADHEAVAKAREVLLASKVKCGAIMEALALLGEGHARP